MNDASAETGEATADVVTERLGSLGVIRLNRPKALNALTLDMVRAMSAALDDYERDPAVAIVLLEGSGGRALCAGGDIRAIYDSGRAGDDLAETFWREEYQLVSRISRYPKPYVALLDGLVMGGGVGVSVHGSRRVATERTRVAMPEVGIGFIPDVAATWILCRSPGAAGAYVALTGEALDAADAIHVGFADVAAPSASLPDLRAALAEAPPGVSDEALDQLLERFATIPEPGPVEQQRSAIDRAFGGRSLEAIVEALSRDGTDFGERTLATLASKSPTSLKLAFELLVRARSSAALEDCLGRELVVALRILGAHDFYEGIRAAVIDKDRSPRWSPAALGDVGPEEIAAYFAPDGGDPLRFPGGRSLW